MDIHTLHLEHVVLLALCTIITVANSSLYKGVKGIHWFSLYNLAVLLGAIAVALRGQIPDFLSIVIGNLFVVTGYLFFSISLTAFFGSKTTHYYLQGSLLVIAVVTMLQYGWFHNDTRKRLIAYSLVLCFQQAQIAFFLVRQKRAALRVATTSMSLILACLSLANIVRVIGVFMQGAPNNYLNAGPFLAWIVIVNSSLQCGAIVSYVWMTAAHLREDLEIQASTDPLTGLLNRRAIEIAAEQQILACNRSGLLIAAIILDLDGFKQINDTYGHHCGDYTLITVAKCLQNSLRQHDLLARVGGDEFAVLLPDTSLEAAIVIAGKLQTSVEQAKVNYGQDGTTVSMSFGVGQLHPPDHTWEQLVMCCDKALYTAKRSRSNSAPSVRNSSLNFADAKLI
ncbi:MAG TPA: GGDEF domain-containing protein [Edaphobacter sp.]|nr:GGDEF domain-containing protein [Edaphobacter sp.]